jgi:hypothetical protein
MIQVVDDVSYTGCTPGTDCQAKPLFSKGNHQVIQASVPSHRLDVKNLSVLSTCVVDSSHVLSLMTNIKDIDSLTVNVASCCDSREPIHVYLLLNKPAYGPQDVYADLSSCPEVPIGTLMELSASSGSSGRRRRLQRGWRLSASFVKCRSFALSCDQSEQ